MKIGFGWKYRNRYSWCILNQVAMHILEQHYTYDCLNFTGNFECENTTCHSLSKTNIWYQKSSPVNCTYLFPNGKLYLSQMQVGGWGLDVIWIEGLAVACITFTPAAAPAWIWRMGKAKQAKDIGQHLYWKKENERFTRMKIFVCSLHWALGWREKISWWSN